jgi:hypothetical protein
MNGPQPNNWYLVASDGHEWLFQSYYDAMTHFEEIRKLNKEGVLTHVFIDPQGNQVAKIPIHKFGTAALASKVRNPGGRGTAKRKRD